MKEVMVAQLFHNTKLSIHSIVSERYTYLVTEEAAGDVDLLTPYHHNLLTRKNLLGDNRRQPA